MKPAKYLDKPAKSKEKWLENRLVASLKIFRLPGPETG